MLPGLWLLSSEVILQWQHSSKSSSSRFWGSQLGTSNRDCLGLPLDLTLARACASMGPPQLFLRRAKLVFH
jgi:hypothetical protein